MEKTEKKERKKERENNLLDSCAGVAFSLSVAKVESS